MNPLDRMQEKHIFSFRRIHAMTLKKWIADGDIFRAQQGDFRLTRIKEDGDYIDLYGVPLDDETRAERRWYVLSIIITTAMCVYFGVMAFL